MIIKGQFEVKMNPVSSYATGTDGIQLASMSIDKTFHGELEAKSTGQMLMARTPTPTSAGYVAIEQVIGTLSGKAGTFVLQHYGIMDNGKQSLTLEVVPDSATGDLKGLRGSMKIIIENKQHFYEFDYLFS